MTSQPIQQDDGLPAEHERVIGFVSDASVAIHDVPMVVWIDSEGEWWGGLPQSYIKLSEHNWKVDRWTPLQSREAGKPVAWRWRRKASGIYPVGNWELSAAPLTEQTSLRLCECEPLYTAQPPLPAGNGVREALVALLPDHLKWKEDGDGILTITVRKSDLRSARAALTAPVPPSSPVRGAIARIIDPDAFAELDRGLGVDEAISKRLDTAVQKSNAILSLPVQSGEEQEHCPVCHCAVCMCFLKPPQSSSDGEKPSPKRTLMSDEQWKWCETCGDLVDAEIIDGCRHLECRMQNLPMPQVTPPVGGAR